MLMIANQQANQVHERAADHKGKREDRQICLEEQRQDCHTQFQMQQQMMMTMMMMMMSGRNINVLHEDQEEGKEVEHEDGNHEGKEEEN